MLRYPSFSLALTGCTRALLFAWLQLRLLRAQLQIQPVNLLCDGHIGICFGALRFLLTSWLILRCPSFSRWTYWLLLWCPWYSLGPGINRLYAGLATSICLASVAVLSSPAPNTTCYSSLTYWLGINWLYAGLAICLASVAVLSNPAPNTTS
jgi:hypothetical protein